MNIKIEKLNLKPEEDLLTGLIISDRFIREIDPILNTKLLQIPIAKHITRWCKDYYKNYNKAPRQHIQDLYNSHIRENKITEDQAEFAERLLLNLSEKFEETTFNEQFILDQSEKYLASRKLEILKEDITAKLARGDIDQAELAVAKYKRTERSRGTSFDILRDTNIIKNDLNSESNPLFVLPGVLGQMVGGLEREDFFSILAPMKRGKSFWMMELGIRAMLQGLKVLYVNMEMSRIKLVKRLYQNFLGETRRAKEIKMLKFKDNTLLHETVSKKGLNTRKALKKARALNIMLKGGSFRLVSYPTRSANLQTIKSEVENLAEFYEFYPDMIIVDYFDILAPEPGSPRDTRQAMDYTWATGRGLAQELNCILVTASQSTRRTFNNDITEEDIAEDIRKIAHVTHMMALNQTKEEKENNIMRASMLAVRDDEFHVTKEAMIIYQFEIAKAFLDSRWKNEVIF